MKFNGKWLPEHDRYKKSCVRSAKNLLHFKQDPDYIKYVGNDVRGQAVVNAFDKVVTLPYVQKNDTWGNPITWGGKSAGTLRFMKVVQDLEKWQFNSVVEIGGGYGGQCLVMKEFKDVEYTIIDIPDALTLSRTYLKANDVKCNFISSDNVPEIECDLLLSDYCLSEFNVDGVEFYLNRVKSKYSYITSNANGKMKEDLEQSLSKRYSITSLPENPKTTHHNNTIYYGVAHSDL